jgi:predicted transcriptional regulator of viral defense system
MGQFCRCLKVDILGYTERMPTDRFSELAETAADQFGLVTVADARGVGYRAKTLSKLARRGQLERVSRGVYRLPFLPGGEMQAYMAAALWPLGVQGVLSHDTALDLWDVSDVNPAKIHIIVPREHRPQREIPKMYVVHREHLDPAQVTAIEGIPVVKLAVALRQCARAHLGADLLEQAARHGRARGLLSAQEHQALIRELGLERVAGRA